jgi:hypothetical protein
MSGIIAPAIVNYDWIVKVSDPSYLNVSFPFRVKIQSIWFTTQQDFSQNSGLWNTTNGEDENISVDIETTDRRLSLAAVKTKNSKTQHSQYDNPTDFMLGFEDGTYDFVPNEELKPTMWLGNPDSADAEGNVGAWATQPYFGSGTLDLRSTAAAPIDRAHANNYSWSEEEYNANTYLADVAVMNTDEFLQLFVYAHSGDWSGYQNDAKVTISVAYTGVSNEEAVSATAKPWTAWWNN